MEASESTTSQVTKKACVSCGKEFAGDLTNCPDDGTVLTQLNQDNLVGSVLADRYEIIELLSEGGMGKVYKAKHLLMKRIVAIKMLHPNIVASATMLKRFQQEAQATSTLNHPNLLTVFDFGVTQNGLAYLVMDYLEGVSLDDEINKDGHLPLKRALKIFIQCCQGLAHAHQKGVVHRDIKPANIMLITYDDQPDFVKIVDFGIAKLLSSQEGESSHLTQTGDVFGSPVYMSPEQCRGKALDSRTDIYSLGCVVYKSITGCAPCSGEDLMSCMYRQVHDLPPGFSEACPELQLPESLEKIIFKALAKEPDERYQSMVEFKQALEEILMQMTDNVPVSVLQDLATKIDAQALSTTGSQQAQSITAQGLPAQGTPAISTTKSPGDISTKDAPALSSNSQAALSSNNQTVLSSNNQTDFIRLMSSFLAGIASAAAQSGTISIAGKSIKKLYLILAGSALVLLIGILSLTMFKGKSSPDQELSAPPDKAPAVVQGSQPAPQPPAVEDKEKQAFQSQFDKAQATFNSGKYADAAKLAEDAVDTAHGFGTTDPDYVKSVMLLGEIYYSQGRYDESQNMFVQIIDAVLQNSGEQSTQYADLLADIGRTATALHNYERAEQYLQKSLDIRQQVLGPTNLAVADSLSGLGYLDLQQRDYVSAQRLLTRALNIRQDKLGNDNLVVASAMNDLGQACQLADDRTQAEALYKRALAIRTRKLDKNNPLIADTLYCLAALMSQKNNMKQALAYCKQALEIQQKSLLPDNPSLLRTQSLYNQLKHAVPVN